MLEFCGSTRVDSGAAFVASCVRKSGAIGNENENSFAPTTRTLTSIFAFIEKTSDEVDRSRAHRPAARRNPITTSPAEKTGPSAYPYGTASQRPSLKLASIATKGAC